MRLSFINRRRADAQIRDLLLAHADALVSGTLDLNRLLAKHRQVPLSQVEDLFALAEQIQRTLVQVTPSEQFVARLHQELLAPEEVAARSWWGRLRGLPPRTQLAAGIGGATLTAGVVILASRSVPDAIDHWRQRRAATA
jgi:hypothetical protein